MTNKLSDFEKVLELKKKYEEKLKEAMYRYAEATEGEGAMADHENSMAELANGDIALYASLIGECNQLILEEKKRGIALQFKDGDTGGAKKAV